jgi:hypothetical protein
MVVQLATVWNGQNQQLDFSGVGRSASVMMRVQSMQDSSAGCAAGQAEWDAEEA